MENYKVILRSKENGSNKTLLNKGLVPGILYGKGTEATKIAFETARKHLLHNDIRIVFCCFDESVWDVYQSIFEQHRKNISKESSTNIENP